MIRTPVLQQGLSNAWLKSQGLVSIEDLWIKGQGYAICATTGFEARTNLVVPPTADLHGGWCGGRELETLDTRLGLILADTASR